MLKIKSYTHLNQRVWCVDADVTDIRLHKLDVGLDILSVAVRLLDIGGAAAFRTEKIVPFHAWSQQLHEPNLYTKE